MATNVFNYNYADNTYNITYLVSYNIMMTIFVLDIYYRSVRKSIFDLRQ